MSAITNTHPQIGMWITEGRLTSDQGMTLCDEARAIEDEDPYGMEPYVSVWEARPWVSRVWLINEYEVRLAYGGPEEGGWYYDEYIPTERIISMHLDEDDAHEVASHLRAFAHAHNRHANYTSVLPHDTEVRYVVESCVPRYPRRPVYC